MQVLHAIIAVGSLHMACSGGAFKPSDRLDACSPKQLALCHYSKAISELRSRIGNQLKRPNADIVLLTCLLFIGFEMLQHDIPVAMDHLRFGLKLICDEHRAALGWNDACSGALVLKSVPDKPMDELIPVFARLDYVSILLLGFSKVGLNSC